MNSLGEPNNLLLWMHRTIDKSETLSFTIYNRHINIDECNLIFFFLTSLLEYNCFTMLCLFLLYNKVNQLYIYIYPHILSLLRLPPSHPPYPTPLGGHKAPSWCNLILFVNHSLEKVFQMMKYKKRWSTGIWGDSLSPYILGGTPKSVRELELRDEFWNWP